MIISWKVNTLIIPSLKANNSHLQTPASLKTVRVIFNCVLLALLYAVILAPSGRIQMMMASGLLSMATSMQQIRETLSPNRRLYVRGPCNASEGPASARIVLLYIANGIY